MLQIEQKMQFLLSRQTWKFLILMLFFLKETLYNKYVSNALKIRGKNLTEEEKKEVYRSAFKDTRKKLMGVFTNDQVKKIIKLEKESFQK
jgi:hypothetical protein